MSAEKRGFSFSPSGRWSARQLPHVLAVLVPEADAMGLELVDIEVTTHGDACSWWTLVARCRLHGVPVPFDCHATCPECVRRC